MVLAEFFRIRLAMRSTPFPRLKTTDRSLRVSAIFGSFLFAATLLWPGVFFPCVWLCFIFLLEPLCFRLGIPSLASDMERNLGTRFWSWVAAGFTAGFVWEFFNFWAGSHWEYSLPYFEFGRIFQMPVLGYFGFIPFALEVMAAYGLILYLRDRSLFRAWYVKLSFSGLLLLFDAGVFSLIDRFTWQP
jgi:hypothetical protein